MFQTILNKTQDLSTGAEFEKKREVFEAAARQRMDRYYGIALPKRVGESGFLYSPNGIFQAIDHFWACSERTIGVLEGTASGAVLSKKEMEEQIQKQMFEIQLNITKGASGICIEEAGWAVNVGENTSDWFYLLIKVITNISLGQISNFVFFYYSKYTELANNINFIRLDDSGYDLLRRSLSRMAEMGDHREYGTMSRKSTS